MATTNELIALGNDSRFRQRVRTLMLQVAATVYAEEPGVPARKSYAVSIIQNPAIAEALAPVIATFGGAATVSYDFDRSSVVTNASDAAITTVIQNNWDLFAGV